jgi:lipopolysaccharide/colanic/teichoic acid biosynthesis glycosyltransferase
MGAWLFFAPLLLAVVLPGVCTWLFHGWPAAWRYRSAFLASTGLTFPVWCWLYLRNQASPQSALLVAAGSFVGSVVATTFTSGFVEDNARPSPGVQEKVLAYHADLRCPPEPALKRPFDIGLSLVALAVTFPLWIIVAFVIWFEEPGPIFFAKNSVGRGGSTFHEWKFRSMKYDAERLTGPIASCANDPRTLKIGRWLRRWHLDELPEVLNVLSGTMSLVGPRPLRTVLVQTYLEETPGFARRHTVRPGIVCIAQIEKYHMSPAERLHKDRMYIRRMSVPFDIKLLGRAVVTTLRGEREYTPR